MGITCWGRGRIKKGLPPAPTVDQRVAALEENLAALEKEVSSAFAEQQAIKRELEDRIAAETSAIKNSLDAVKRDLEALAVGSHALLAFGAFWLAVGVLLAGFVPELTPSLKQ